MHDTLRNLDFMQPTKDIRKFMPRKRVTRAHFRKLEFSKNWV